LSTVTGLRHHQRAFGASREMNWSTKGVNVLHRLPSSVSVLKSDGEVILFVLYDSRSRRKHRERLIQ
jgi:hypothetical protein